MINLLTFMVCLFLLHLKDALELFLKLMHLILNALHHLFALFIALVLYLIRCHFFVTPSFSSTFLQLLKGVGFES